MNIARTQDAWQPPESITRDEIVARSAAILGQPDLPLRQSEDIFRIHALGLDWDMGAMVYEPAETARLSRGADGKRIGVFLLHGGSGDYKSMEPMAKLLAAKFGCTSSARRQYSSASMARPATLNRLPRLLRHLHLRLFGDWANSECETARRR